MTLAPVIGAPRGATWGPDGTIVFAAAGPDGLQRVSSDGGNVTVLTTPNRERGEADHVYPEFLPDGRALLFTILPTTGGVDNAEVAVLDLDTRALSVLFRGGSHARYIATGHLIYVAGGSARAVPFDVRRRVITGAAIPIPESIAVATGTLGAVVSNDGTLVYVSSEGDEPLGGPLVFVDRQGREEAVGLPPRMCGSPRLSPDGSRIVVSCSDEEQDLWVWDRGRKTLTQLTFDPARDTLPFWTPDGSTIIFSSDRMGQQNLFTVSADGTGAPKLLIESPNPQAVTGIVPDVNRAIIYEQTTSGPRDLRIVTLTGTPRVETLFATPADERGGIVSPDGRWLAYESNSLGRYEVHVRPFPSVENGQWRVSSGGGTQPVWTAGGRELIYRGPDGRHDVGARFRGGHLESRSTDSDLERQLVLQLPCDSCVRCDAGWHALPHD